MKNDTTPQAKTYKVIGFAMVPWECEIDVDANSEEGAMEKARKVFKREGKNCLVANGQDVSAVHSFEPSEANIRE